MKFVQEWNDATNCATEWTADSLDASKPLGRWISRVLAAGHALSNDYIKLAERADREAHLAVLLREKLHEVAGPDVASSVNV